MSKHADANADESVWCIVVAGGAGTRFGQPKQFLDLDGRRVIDVALDVARASCDGTVLVVPADSVESESRLQGGNTVVVAGGATRSESVRAGIEAVPGNANVVLVHDGARPLASAALYKRVIDAVIGGAVCVVPVVPVVDSLRSIGGGVVDRDTIRAVQTPQGFRRDVLLQAHSTTAEATDDASLVEATGYEVVMVDGESSNRKITEPVDLIVARALCKDDAILRTANEPQEGADQ